MSNLQIAHYPQKTQPLATISMGVWDRETKNMEKNNGILSGHNMYRVQFSTLESGSTIIYSRQLQFLRSLRHVLFK